MIERSPIQAIVSNIRALMRALTFVLALISYFVVAPLIYPYFLINPMGARRIINKLVTSYARFCCWFMGIKVKRNIEEEFQDGESYLVVSNHLSYTDILAICAYYPSCFVTSVEMRDTPVLGHICKLAGCVFVERRNKKNLGVEVQEITEALSKGLNVVIFPEATSTNGEEVIRFRRPLYRSAIDSGRRVKPLAVNYKTLEGHPVSLANRDLVFWYGDMTFADHLWGVFKLKYLEVELFVGKSLSIEEGDDHATLAERSFEVVSKNYIKVTS